MKSNRWDLEPEALQEDHTGDWFGAYESYRQASQGGLLSRPRVERKPTLSEYEGDFEL